MGRAAPRALTPPTHSQMGARVRVLFLALTIACPRPPFPQGRIRQLLPGREDEQTKLQILIMELKDEKREGESEERACRRLLERKDDEPPALVHKGACRRRKQPQRQVVPADRWLSHRSFWSRSGRM